MKKYKLIQTLYADVDCEFVDTEKWEDSILFAKKGMIFELIEITPEVREEYCIYDKMWKFMFLHKSGKYILSQDGDTSNFIKMKEENNYGEINQQNS